MSNSKIEWTNETINIITGCSKKSEGCRNCFAEKMHKRLKAMGQAKYNLPFNNVVFHYDVLATQLGTKPKMYFVNSMSDTFHEKISDEQIDKILAFCGKYPQHVFQILTKRAERITNFIYPDNVWLGVTVENTENKERIEHLKKAKANIKFLSCKPLIGDLGELNLDSIDWVICGGESGCNARPMHPNWVRNIQKQCKEQGVAFFFKQWGEWVYTGGEVIKDNINNPAEPSFVRKRTNYGKFLNKESLLDGKEYKEFPKRFKE